MNIDRSLARFERTLERWEQALASLDDAAFTRLPADGGWSVGQVCDHVAGAGQLILDQVQRCADGEAEVRGFQLKGALVALLGSIPPVRVKVPDVPLLETVARPANLARDAALGRLRALASRTRSMAEPARGASPRQRTRHPLAGYLNAGQWFQFNEMHLRHHLRQLARLRE